MASCSRRAACTVGQTTLAPTAPTALAAASSWCSNSCHRINSVLLVLLHCQYTLLVQLVNLFHPLTTLWIVCCLSPGFILSSLFGPSLSSFPDSLLDLLFFSHSRNSLFSDLAQYLLFSQFLIYFYSHNCDIS